MAKRPATRAQEASFSTRAFEGKVNRFVADTRKRLEKIAYEATDVHGGIDYACTDLERDLDQFVADMGYIVAYLNQPPEQEG